MTIKKAIRKRRHGQWEKFIFEAPPELAEKIHKRTEERGGNRSAILRELVAEFFNVKPDVSGRVEAPKEASSEVG